MNAFKPGQLDGMEVENDLGLQLALLLTVPQAYLEYTSSDWDPPSRWDDGNFWPDCRLQPHAQTRHQEQGARTHMISAVTVQLGQTFGAWRFRADWQSDYQHTRSNDDEDDSSNSTTSKTGTGAVITPRRAFTLFKSEAVAGRRLSQFPIFSTALTISAAVSALMTRCCRPISAAMRQMFLAWRTAAQK